MADAHASNVAKNVVCLRWAIGARVRIIDCDCVGTVFSAVVSKDGIEYSVKWFNESGVRCFDWFQDHELEAKA